MQALKYKLANIQLKYEMIRSNTLANEAHSTYYIWKEFDIYNHVMWAEVVTFSKCTDTWNNLRVNPQRTSLKGIILLFIELYGMGTRDSEKCLNPDLTKDSVTVNSIPNMPHNNSIKGKNIWEENSHFFETKKQKVAHKSEEVLH